jgi:hypothetical protein
VFFTYLHRLHHYATTRNPRAGELKREALAAKATPRQSFLRRVKRRVAGPKPLAAFDDPLTTMQFRALDWILTNESRLAQKRHRVQSMRKRPDREIFERFPLHIIPTYPGDEELMRSALFRLLRPALPSVERTLSDIIRT